MKVSAILKLSSSNGKKSKIHRCHKGKIKIAKRNTKISNNLETHGVFKYKKVSLNSN